MLSISSLLKVSEDAKFVPGVWGPYYSAMVPGLWLNEGGQSATGKLVSSITLSQTNTLIIHNFSYFILLRFNLKPIYILVFFRNIQNYYCVIFIGFIVFVSTA